MPGNGGGPATDGPKARPVSVRVGKPHDAPVAGALHAQLITEGFLSSLGPRFLARLYRRIALSQESFLLIAESQGAPIGFIAGSLAVGRLYRNFLVRDGIAAALSAPVRLATALPRVFETLRHGSGGDVHEGGELLAVAVDPRWRGRQVGRLLVEGFLGELAQRGTTAAYVVVGAENSSAIAMYRRAGFAPVRTFELHRGTPSLVMETAVPGDAGPDLRPGS